MKGSFFEPRINISENCFNNHMEFRKVNMSESNLVFSANKTGIAFLFMTAGKSFMYKRNSVGPSTEPCGTLCLIIAQFIIL